VALSLEIENVDELTLLTDALLRVLGTDDEEADTDVPAEMDPLIDKILGQAESGVTAPYELELEPEEAERIADALEAFLDFAAEEGDVFRTAEIESLMRRLGRG
jgi:hypothetical protein